MFRGQCVGFLPVPFACKLGSFIPHKKDAGQVKVTINEDGEEVRPGPGVGTRVLIIPWC